MLLWDQRTNASGRDANNINIHSPVLCIKVRDCAYITTCVVAWHHASNVFTLTYFTPGRSAWCTRPPLGPPLPPEHASGQQPTAPARPGALHQRHQCVLSAQRLGIADRRCAVN